MDEAFEKSFEPTDALIGFDGRSGSRIDWVKLIGVRFAPVKWLEVKEATLIQLPHNAFPENTDENSTAKAENIEIFNFKTNQNYAFAEKGLLTINGGNIISISIPTHNNKFTVKQGAGNYTLWPSFIEKGYYLIFETDHPDKNYYPKSLAVLEGNILYFSDKHKIPTGFELNQPEQNSIPDKKKSLG